MPRRLWIGGAIQAPFYVTEPEPRRPDFVAWIDTVSGRILECEVAEPGESTGALVSCLAKAIQAAKGKRPDRIRVADADLAQAVSAVVNDRVAIEIAPTPELAEIVGSMKNHFDSVEEVMDDGEAPSYVEGGRIPPVTIARLFESAAKLFSLEPWSKLWDTDTIGLDIPDYGLRGAVLSVIGAARDSFGFILFESASAFDAFAAAGSDPLRRSNDIGASILSLNFDTKSRIPKPMQQEISRYGWKVAGRKAYPHIMAVDQDMVLRPLSEHDVLVVCAAAESLARFVSTHGARFSPAMETIVEDYSIGDLEKTKVRLTAPHPEMPWPPSERDPMDFGLGLEDLGFDREAFECISSIRSHPLG